MSKLKKTAKFIFYTVLLCSVIFVIGVLIPAPSFPFVGNKGNFLIKNVTIVDTQTGELRRGQHVLIRDGQITEISSRTIYPEDGLVLPIEAEGKYLIPGLWDMHTRSLKRSPYFHHPLFIANGVTHVRDLSGCLTSDDPYWACTSDRKQWTEQARSGKGIAPLYHQNSTFPINGGAEVPDDFPDYLRADSYEKAATLVEFSQSMDADFMVIGPEIGKRAYLGIALEAAKSGLTLAGNKPISTSLYEALATYQRSIDEPWLFASECFKNTNNYREANNPALIFSAQTRYDMTLTHDPAQCSGLMTAMAASDTWWTPSLSELKASAFAGNKAFLKNENKKYIARLLRFGQWRRVRGDYKSQSKGTLSTAHKDFYELIKNQVGLAHTLGVKILAGTHSNSPYVYSGFSLHDELTDLVEAGLSNQQALRAATLDPARFSGQDADFGSILPGNIADLVLLDANPLDDIRNTQEIHAVFTYKTYYDRDDLDRLLAFSKKIAKSWHMNTKLLWDTLRSPIIQHEIKKDYKRLENKLRAKFETEFGTQE